MKNSFTTALEIVVGLNTLQKNFNRWTSTLTVEDVNGYNSTIQTSIDYIMKFDPKIILSITRHGSTRIDLTIDAKRLDEFFDDYAHAYSFSLFDGKMTEKKIECKNKEEANRLMQHIDSLCSFGMYSGYCFDHGTNVLIAFI